jgi:hypothetical protein
VITTGYFPSGIVTGACSTPVASIAGTTSAEQRSIVRKIDKEAEEEEEEEEDVLCC